MKSETDIRDRIEVLRDGQPDPDKTYHDDQLRRRYQRVEFGIQQLRWVLDEVDDE